LTKNRGFELVSKYEGHYYLLPERATAHSAGYDLMAAETIEIQPNEIKLVPTGVKSYMNPNEVLLLMDRSSNPRKKGIVTINSVGVIDSDYYNNKDNEGLIFGQFKNITDKPIVIQKGERIVQGIFTTFLTVDEDKAEGTREGGFGSTN